MASLFLKKSLLRISIFIKKTQLLINIEQLITMQFLPL